MRNILIALFASLFISSAALAGQYGIGVTGSFAAVSGEGTEANKDGSTDTSNRTANAHNNVIIPSVFAEYTMDNGFTLGYDYVIGSADVNSRKISRTDTTADDNEAVQDDGHVRHAAARTPWPCVTLYPPCVGKPRPVAGSGGTVFFWGGTPRPE